MHSKIIFFCSEGATYIVLSLLVSVIPLVWAVLRPGPVSIVTAVLAGLLMFEVCYFFRDPERVAPEDPTVAVAPADGKIIDIRPMREESFIKEECVRVSIFMNIFSVHVNRAPISGKIAYRHYNPGKFISAFKEKASTDNEQVAIGIEGAGENTQRVLVRLIAGLIARRIVVWKTEGDAVGKGERMSIIKFGSRADVYLPSGVAVKVKEGQWVKAGETILCTY
jgi:phosphatidylserine decarboxylase